MTTSSPVPPQTSGRTTSGPSVHVLRARKLLYGGLVGGLAAGLICMIVLTIVGGLPGLGSSALGVGMVVFFYAVGQLVMVRFADAGARTLMAVSMTSYTGRVVILGLILLFFSKNRDAWSGLDADAIFIATIAVVVGWLAVEVGVFRRLRISIYDTEYTGPPQTFADPDTPADNSRTSQHTVPDEQTRTPSASTREAGR